MENHKESTQQQIDYESSECSTSTNSPNDEQIKLKSLPTKQKKDEELSDIEDDVVLMDTELDVSQSDDQTNGNQFSSQLSNSSNSNINGNNDTIDHHNSFILEDNQSSWDHPACQFRTDKQWLDRQFQDNDKTAIKKPDELENTMEDPPNNCNDNIVNRIQGSMIGMALGDALGAHVEFRPKTDLIEHPVKDLQGGGTWGLQKGQFTDDTSMALCLANSLVARRDFVPYDQLVRYQWWYKYGYMSSTGKCFDIGTATKDSLREFGRRQKEFAKENDIPIEQLDSLSDENLLNKFNVFCSGDSVAGNGALMRLAPVPLFFCNDPIKAVQFSGISGKITHGDQKAYDACRYYGALIVAAIRGETKEMLLDENFYSKHQDWFNDETLHSDIIQIAQGSFKKSGGYDEGIRGKGYIVNALEAALWAFWSDENSFEVGALNAVNLGDDTDTTAAIYGQLAGAYYGYKSLPTEWVKQVYAKKFIETLSKWMVYEGQRWQTEEPSNSTTSSLASPSPTICDTIPTISIMSTLYSNLTDVHLEVSETPSIPHPSPDPSTIEKAFYPIKHEDYSEKCDTDLRDEQTTSPSASTSKTGQFQGINITVKREDNSVVHHAFSPEVTFNSQSTVPKRKLSQCE